MNVLKAVVTEVNNNPVKHSFNGRDYWTIEVKYDCYGRISTKDLYFNTEEEADAVEAGYEFET